MDSIPPNVYGDAGYPVLKMLEHAGLKISERVIYNIGDDSVTIVYHCDALDHSFMVPSVRPWQDMPLTDSRNSAFEWFENYAAAHKDLKLA